MCIDAYPKKEEEEDQICGIVWLKKMKHEEKGIFNVHMKGSFES
jgi:hypothetical protein